MTRQIMRSHSNTERIRYIHDDGYISRQVEERLREVAAAARVVDEEELPEEEIMRELFRMARERGGLKRVAILSGLNRDTVRFWQRRHRVLGPRLRDVLAVFATLGCTLQVREVRDRGDDVSAQH